MTIYRKASGSWTTIRNVYRKSGGVWTSVENVYRKASGVWNSVFLRNNSPVIKNKVTIATNLNIITDGQTATLTGTNYSWTPTSGLTLTYRFEKSTSITFASSTLVTSGNIANPASGSSNTVTQSISPSDFSQTDMYFRFKVTAVNSYGTTISVSDIIGISYIGTPVPQSGSPSITGSTTVGNNAFGNIGVWTSSPTSYTYRWYFMSGITSYPLTFSQSRSVSNKSLSGFTATITTSQPHGYKTSDITIITSMDSLFNKSSATISSVTSNSFSYSINPPTAWADAGTGYSIGTYVSYSGSVYSASSTISSSSPYNGGTMYSSGAIVYSGTNRYQSKVNNNIGNSVTNTTFWNNLGSYAPGGSFWTLENFSNVAASGTITGPNYYEGTAASSTSFLLNVPATDYKSQLNMIDKALYFGVKAYNSVTPSPAEYTDYKLVYGYPVITLGTPTYPTSTTAQIPFTNSYAAKYSIDVTRAGTSLNPYPFIATPATSPINISGLTAGFTYTVNVYPINGEETYGALKTTTITAPNAPGPVTDLQRTLGNAGSKTFTWSAPTTGGAVVSYDYQLNALGWISNGSSTSISLTGLSGSNTFQVRAVGSSLTGTPTSTGSFTIPTINSGPTSGSVTSSTARISWTQTNQNSWSLSGVGSHTGTNEIFKDVSLSASTSYTPTLTITSITGDTATTTGTQFTTLAPSPTVSGLSISDTTTTPGSATSITVGNSATTNVGSVSWSNGTNTTTAWLYSVTGSGSGGTTTDPGSANTSGTFTIGSSGTANVTIRAVNKSKTVTATWTQSGAQSYSISYSVAGSGAQTLTGNSSASSPSILIYSNTGTATAVTISSVTVYSGANQTGTSSVASASGSVTPANKTTDSTGSGSVTYTPAVQPVVWGAMTSPVFSRGASSLRWGWNHQLPTSGDYTASNIQWFFQFSSSNATTTQSLSPTGLIASGTKPSRIGGGLTVGSSTFDNRVSSQSADYSVGYPAVTGEPVAYNAAARYLRYRGTVVGTNGTTYVSNFSPWV